MESRLIENSLPTQDNATQDDRNVYLCLERGSNPLSQLLNFSVAYAPKFYGTNE